MDWEGGAVLAALPSVNLRRHRALSGFLESVVVGPLVGRAEERSYWTTGSGVPLTGGGSAAAGVACSTGSSWGVAAMMPRAA
jgi:hypothetical protein